jgi:hypothetical protein
MDDIVHFLRVVQKLIEDGQIPGGLLGQLYFEKVDPFLFACLISEQEVLLDLFSHIGLCLQLIQVLV